ncbi:MAG: hypothetical protein HQL47_05415 [Gammaproteobacteria bacterium]|nr:hypothetical protein [Gammaproteobacteria bacterium]
MTIVYLTPLAIASAPDQLQPVLNELALLHRQLEALALHHPDTMIDALQARFHLEAALAGLGYRLQLEPF